MGDQIKNLRKENEKLKKQIYEVPKRAVSKNQHGGSTGAKRKEHFDWS